MEAQKILQVFATVWILQLSSTLADELYCSVTGTPEGTLYQVNHTDGHWDIFWDNATHHTLAHQFESQFNKTDQVLCYNETHLLLPGCQEVIFYTRSDDKGATHTATCTTTCSQKQPEPAGPVTCSQKQPEPAGRKHIGIYCSLGLLVFLGLVLVLVGLQDRLSNICSKLRFNKVPKEDEHNDAEAASG